MRAKRHTTPQIGYSSVHQTAHIDFPSTSYSRYTQSDYMRVFNCVFVFGLSMNPFQCQAYYFEFSIKIVEDTQPVTHAGCLRTLSIHILPLGTGTRYTLHTHAVYTYTIVCIVHTLVTTVIVAKKNLLQRIQTPCAWITKWIEYTRTMYAWYIYVRYIQRNISMEREHEIHATKIFVLRSRCGDSNSTTSCHSQCT